jgi:hypothetical protein
MLLEELLLKYKSAERILLYIFQCFPQILRRPPKEPAEPYVVRDEVPSEYEKFEMLPKEIEFDGKRCVKGYLGDRRYHCF